MHKEEIMAIATKYLACKIAHPKVLSMKLGSPQLDSPQIKVDKASLKVMTSPTDIIKTSPLPRSDYAKDKGTTII